MLDVTRSGKRVTVTEAIGKHPSKVAVPLTDKVNGGYVITAIGNGKSSTGLAGMVTIPASVTSIGNEVFSYCRGLTNVTFDGACPNVDDKPSLYRSHLKGASLTGYVARAYASSWSANLDRGTLAAAVWCGRSVRLTVD